MAHVITSRCVGTLETACTTVCPMDCIAGPVPLDVLRALPRAERIARFGSVQLFIDPDSCIDCGACIAVCPVGAIFGDDDVPADEHDAIARNEAFFA